MYEKTTELTNLIINNYNNKFRFETISENGIGIDTLLIINDNISCECLVVSIQKILQRIHKNLTKTINARNYCVSFILFDDDNKRFLELIPISNNMCIDPKTETKGKALL